MQYKVPQNIDLEDKIVGPFTMKQFIYLLVSGAIVYGWWNYLSTNYVAGTYTIEFIVIALPVGLLGISLALVKINDRPFEVFLLSIIKFLLSPKQRVWKEGFKSEPVIMVDKAEAPQVQKTVRDTGTLDDLAKSLEAQSEQLKGQQAIESKTKKSPVSKTNNPLNISVKDVKSASLKQEQAQGVTTRTIKPTPKPTVDIPKVGSQKVLDNILVK